MPEAGGPVTGPRVHFFSGKGGVGKTTLAAATAMHLARAGRRVLITSTDPAHNLADVFERSIGDQGAEIEKNLRALEIDASARWSAVTGSMQAAQGAVRGRRGRVQSALLEAMGPLGEAPGVDEFVSLELMVEAMHSREFEVVVFDTAPTGHALRLLFLPQVLDGWLGRMLALRDAFSWIGRGMRRLLGRREGEAALVEGWRSARGRMTTAREWISDPAHTHFGLVTIPEAMSVLETERTLQQLAVHGVPVGTLFVNGIQPESAECPHCRARREIHLRELQRIRTLAREVPLRLVESQPRVIRGVEALAELGELLWK